METKFIKLDKLQPNTGQVKGLPKNPRLIKDVKFEKLVKSIRDDPEMLELRELIVYPVEKAFVVIGGNMRLQAMIEIGMTEAPCKVVPKSTPVEKLKAYTIKDNIGYGQDDWDLLSAEWDTDQLEEWGMDVPSFGPPPEEEDKSDAIEPGFKVETACENEQEQEKLFNELTNRGYQCRLLTL